MLQQRSRATLTAVYWPSPQFVPDLHLIAASLHWCRARSGPRTEPEHTH